MVGPNRSRAARNTLGPLFAAAGVAPAAFAEAAGLERRHVEALASDDRMMPDARTIQAACMAFGVGPGACLAFAPETATLAPLLDLAPEQRVAVAVCGGGNLGHVFAGLLSARPDLDVRLLVSSPERAALIEAGLAEHGGIRVRRREGDVVGRPALVTADPARAVADAHIVLMCLPTSVEAACLARIAPHLRDGAIVGSIPAPGGFQWIVRDVLGASRSAVTVFGVGAIPWMCKLRRPGCEVEILGGKAVNGQVTLGDGARSGVVSDILAHLTGMPFVALDSFLPITLNPGNQLLHPGILYAMVTDNGDQPFPEAPLFYEGLSERAAGVLEALSGELMAIRGRLEAADAKLDLSSVLPLQLSVQVAYGSDVADPTTLRSTIATNRAYAGIRTPVVRTDGGWVPDPNSRFFQEDVPFGLVVLKGIAALGDVPTPTLDTVLEWAQARMGRHYLVAGALKGADVMESGAPQRFGLADLAAVIRTSC